MLPGIYFTISLRFTMVEDGDPILFFLQLPCFVLHISIINLQEDRGKNTGLAERHCLQRVGTAAVTKSSLQWRPLSWGFYTFGGGIVLRHNHFLCSWFVWVVDRATVTK